MKNLYKKIIALIISVLVLFLSGWSLLSKEKEFSENENRYLEKSPNFSIKSLLDKSYIKKIEAYFSDQFPLRDNFMGIKTNYDKLLGKKDINDVFFAENDYLIEKYKKPLNTDKIINSLNNFYNQLNYVNMDLMLVPTSVSINKNLLPKNAFTYNQLETIDYIYDNVNFNQINIYNSLLENNKKYPMFYRLDHHWTSFGAYYAYLEYCKLNDIDYLDINAFEIEEVTDNFKGTLYSKSNDYSKQPDKIHVFIPPKHNYEVNYVSDNIISDSLYEMSYLNKKDKYSIFLKNNHPLIVITNKDVTNDKEIVVIKDSYANSFVPFLINHYNKVHIIDPRFYKLSIVDYVKDNNNIRDILILYNMNTIDNDNGIMSIS